MTDCVLVPREPTEAMYEAAFKRGSPENGGWEVSYKNIYQAMIAAAPPADAQPVALERWGFKEGIKDGGWAERMPDGYWTPWHIAQAAVNAAPPAIDRELIDLLAGLQETYAAVLSPQMCAAIDSALTKLTEGR
jgi:hypothetical protein